MGDVFCILFSNWLAEYRREQDRYVKLNWRNP